MYNLNVYNAMTEALTNHQEDIDYARDVVKALEDKLVEAKANLENEERVHTELSKMRRQFSPNAIDRILADREKQATEDTEGSLAVLKVLNIVE